MKLLWVASMGVAVLAALWGLPFVFDIAYGYAGVFGLMILLAAYLALAGAVLKWLWRAFSSRSW